jgi:hypothetical protein
MCQATNRNANRCNFAFALMLNDLLELSTVFRSSQGLLAQCLLLFSIRAVRNDSNSIPK